MYHLLACDLEDCINDVEYVYIFILKPSFNIFIVKKLCVAHKDWIWLSRTIQYTNQSNKYLGFFSYHSSQSKRIKIYLSSKEENHLYKNARGFIYSLLGCYILCSESRVEVDQQENSFSRWIDDNSKGHSTGGGHVVMWKLTED
jgi:hypothetical protein